MSWFKNLRIALKLQLGFVVVAAVAGFIGYEALNNMSAVSARTEAMYKDRLVPLRDLGYANAAFLVARTEVRNIFLTQSKDERKNLINTIEEQTRNYEKYVESYAKSNMSEEEKAVFARLGPPMKDYFQARDGALQLAQQGRDKEALSILDGDARKDQAEARKVLRELIDRNAADAEKDYQAVTTAAAENRKSTIILIAIGVAIAIALGFLLARLIGQPLKQMQEAAAKLAVGDVSAQVELESKDEMGALAQSFRETAATIKDRSQLAQKIAAGDVTAEVKALSDQDLLGKSFAQVIDVLRKLTAESDALTKAAVAGKLATRGNAAQFQGG